MRTMEYSWARRVPAEYSQYSPVEYPERIARATLRSAHSSSAGVAHCTPDRVPLRVPLRAPHSEYPCEHPYEYPCEYPCEYRREYPREYLVSTPVSTPVSTLRVPM